MSLEQAITANTEAIRDLIAAISKGIPTTAEQVAAVVTEAKAEAKTEAKAEKKTKAEKVDKAETEAPKSDEAPAATQEPKDEPAAAADEPVYTYQDAANAITAVSKAKGRDAAVALLAAFRAKNLKEVKPEDYAALIAKAGE